MSSKYDHKTNSKFDQDTNLHLNSTTPPQDTMREIVQLY